jgi:hypothetical protein
MSIKANIVIDQGADYEVTIDITDDNGDIVVLTGYTGAAQMRKHYTSLTAYNFAVSISPLIGAVTISMPAATSANIASGRYVWDCELTSSANVVSRIVEGTVTITPQVTRV